MICTVRLFARARDLAGASAVAVDLPESANVGDLRSELARQVPALQPMLGRCFLAVQAEFVSDDHLLCASDEIALLPPVSGG